MGKMAVLLTLFLTILTGCSDTSAPATTDFKTEALDLTHISEQRMNNKEKLSDKETHRLELFVSKYATKDQQEEKSLIATYLTQLNYLQNSALENKDTTNRLEDMKQYNDLLTKLKTQLNIK